MFGLTPYGVSREDMQGVYDYSVLPRKGQAYLNADNRKTSLFIRTKETRQIKAAGQDPVYRERRNELFHFRICSLKIKDKIIEFNSGIEDQQVFWNLTPDKCIESFCMNCSQ